MKERKTPLRTCVGCGEQRDKRDLVRIVRTSAGLIEVDVIGKVNGRGAYLCRTTGCFDAAVERDRISTALRANLLEDDVRRLRNDLEGLLEDTMSTHKGR